VNQEEQDDALLALLTGNKTADAGQDGHTLCRNPLVITLMPVSARWATTTTSDSGGVEGSRCPKNEARHRGTTTRRFRHYIAEKLPGRPEAEITELVAA
jgi:hypothetical protein